MEIIERERTNFSIKNKDKTVNSEFVFIFARPRYGKSLAVESLLELYHKAGYTILCLSDVKGEWELGYSMFEPEKKYHLDRLRKDGTKPSKKDVILYHPFTTNIPKGSLPDMKIYGFSLKELGRSEFSMISETAWESDTTRLLINASNYISDNAGIYGFIDYIEGNIAGKKDGKMVKRDPNLFGLRVTGGTAKSLQDIASYFLPFRKDYFLLPENSKFNLNWKEILNDNKNYHVFGSCYLKDEKLKEFCVLGLLNAIIKNRKKGKKPILIYIPEIRYLVPYRPEGYKKFLAYAIKSKISIMGNMGKGGIAGVFDSQSYTDTDEDVVKSQTKTFFGELGAKDIDSISKSLRWSKDLIQPLIKSDVDRKSQPSFISMAEPSAGSWTPRFPSHAHAEESYDFDEVYRKIYPEKMKSYDDIKILMKKEYMDEVKKIEEKRKKEDIKLKEESIVKDKSNKDSNVEEISNQKKKINEIKEKNRNRDMKLVYEIYQDDRLDKNQKSVRKIAEKVGISKSTVANYLKDIANFVDTPNNGVVSSKTPQEDDSWGDF